MVVTKTRVFSDRPEIVMLFRMARGGAGGYKRKATHVNQRSTRQGAPVFPVVFNT